MHSLITRRKGDVSFMTIDGELTFDDMPLLTKAVNKIRGPHIIFDMRYCNFINSMCLIALEKEYQSSHKSDAHIVLCNLNNTCKEIMLTSQLYNHVSIYDTIDDCMKNLN